MNELLTIGIVTHNSSDVLQNCLSSIFDNYGDEYRVVIVDNNSTDSTHELVTFQFPNVEIYNTGANYGYGFGVNKVISYCQTPYVLVLNADIEINKNTIKPLIESLENDESITLVAPVTRNKGGEIEGNIRRFPSVLRQFGESFLGGKISKKLNLSETVDNEKAYETNRDVEWIKGAIWCVRRSDFIALARMRTDFFLYSEETEFAYRCSKANKRCMVVASSWATHLGGASDTNPLLYTLLTLNKLRYSKITMRGFEYLTLRAIVVFGLIFRISKPQARRALISLVYASFGLESERHKIIKELGGVLPNESGI